MDDSLYSRVRQVAADVLGIPASEVSLRTSPDSVERWDSVQHLNLVLALEQEFGLQFEPEQIEQMLSVELIVMILSESMGGMPPGSQA